MIVSEDQLGRELRWAQTPGRIVSLVPSITELLCDLGLRDRIVGCTKFCVHPAGLRKEIQIIGGTKSVKIDQVAALQPDLIIANREENTQAEVEQLAERFPTWVSVIATLAEAEEMIRKLAAIFQADTLAEQIIASNRSGLPSSPTPRQRALYLIWRKPYMSVGRDTYIHDIMDRCGYQNVCGDQLRYPSLEDADIQRLQPTVILLSSEPFPFKDKHIAELQALCPTASVRLVDGEYFSWYGSRLGNIHHPTNTNRP